MHDTLPLHDALALSLVMPARNEELVIGRSLDVACAALEATGRPWEAIVVNDGSTDRTAEIARDKGARVIDVELHNIGAVRNAGARTARGAVLVFLDADTLLPPETLQAACRAIDAGAVGGGAWVEFDEYPSWVIRAMAWTFSLWWLRICRWAAGCFLFARRADFEAVGGFDEQYFAAEERYLTEALRRRGRFVILSEHVVSSARKIRLYPRGTLVRLAIRALLVDRGQLRRREGLEILYDAPRETPAGPHG
jgi:glycosyltransferase involved in cell wall biosynthesis